ncbi:MAG TPA: NADH-quinone oxidoreductase subunit M [Stackebrandtia sp.]|jgi:NADH-quinone oxidoreductase subunit M|uniref:complex I subunit 4 family protein n=1 Tax=Stackebrandtia sp. TaxID=2023065 RepID=UPI002D47B723|nr:NADH-quinone oxidoreductase subunit M [Stackebrandtia sp.]HZE39983.1 NADH-quinone oxidoreductase subunit M [Stackebrandtia sp.]
MNLVLVAALALPAVGAVAAFAVRQRNRLAKWVATGFAAAGFLAAAALPLASGDGPMWHRVNLPWAQAIHLRFDIGVDGVSYPLIALTALLTLLCCVHTTIYEPARGSGAVLAALLLAVDVGITGVFASVNLVAFFVFFEIVLLPMWAIIHFWGAEDRRHAAIKFALYTLLGSLLLLAGIFVIVGSTGTADIVRLTQSHGAGMSPGTQVLAFSLLGIGFAIKAPLWPLHTWLPDAHTQAPTVGSVILAGVLLKLGTYGLVRVGVGTTPDGAHRVAPVLAVLAVAAILIGGLVCLAQNELKRLIAYSSVGHMGFVLLGIATMTAAGINAALFGNIAHGLITGLLFFLAGAIKDRAGTGELSKLGGLRNAAPGLAGILGFTALASLGLPGLAGFWGEAFSVYGSASRGSALWITLAVFAALGAALAAAYLLRLLRLVTHGDSSPVVANLGSAAALRRGEIAIWAPITAGILVFGVAPWLLLDGFAGALIQQVVAR